MREFSWLNVRDASAFGRRCFQTVGASLDSRVTEEGEDCLFLNVWTATLESEIRYVFGNLEPPGAYDELDRELSTRMQQAWISFARDGVPSDVQGRPWPAYPSNRIS